MATIKKIIFTLAIIITLLSAGDTPDHSYPLCYMCCIIIGQGQFCTDGDIRLVSWSNVVNQREGRVQVCINSTWGNICNSGWDSRDAGVVCRQLGLSSLGKSTSIKIRDHKL